MTSLACATFPSRREAGAAINRLVEQGFARNSIDLTGRPDDTYEIAVHTRPANLDRVKKLLAEQPGVLAVFLALATDAAQATFVAAQSEVAQHALETAGGAALALAKAHPVVALGAGAAASYALYRYVTRRNRSLRARRGRSR